MLYLVLLYIPAELSILFVDGDMMVVLVCGERDSRVRCLAEKMLVGVFVRNTSLPNDVETQLNRIHLETCIRPTDVQSLVRAYTSALQNGKLCHLLGLDATVRVVPCSSVCLPLLAFHLLEVSRRKFRSS